MFQTNLCHLLDLKSIKQLKRFLVIGGVSTLVSYSIFLLAIHLLSLHYILANILAFCVSIIFSYQCNKRWSFEVADQQKSHLSGYLTLYIASLVVGSAILKILVDFCGIIPEISFVISLFFTTSMNFVGTKFFVFKK